MVAKGLVQRRDGAVLLEVDYIAHGGTIGSLYCGLSESTPPTLSSVYTEVAIGTTSTR
jgi:hypothetical protein